MRLMTINNIKTAVFGSLDLLGVNAYFRARNRHKIRVFALHGVASFDSDSEWRPLRQQMDVAHFERILKRLCKHYEFVSIGDATKMMRGEASLVENAAVMTFDDGYRNNFTRALPILRKYNVPAVFYIATGFVDNAKPYWFDRLDFVLQAAARQGVKFEVAGKQFVFESTNRESLTRSYASLRNHCKSHFPDDRDFADALNELAADLESKTGVALMELIERDEWASVVSSRQIAEFDSDELVTYGGHTVSHLRLSCSSEEDIHRELSESKQQIESWSGSPCVHFAYPNGDYDAASAEIVGATGYESAVTSDFGMNVVGDPVLMIKRLSIAVDAAVPQLLARSSGLEEAISRLVSRLRSS